MAEVSHSLRRFLKRRRIAARSAVSTETCLPVPTGDLVEDAEKELKRVRLDTLLARPLRNLSNFQRLKIWEFLESESPSKEWFLSIVKNRHFSVFGPKLGARILLSAARLALCDEEVFRTSAMRALYQVTSSRVFLMVSLRVKLGILELFDLLPTRGKQILGSLLFSLHPSFVQYFYPKRPYQRSLFEQLHIFLSKEVEGISSAEYAQREDGVVRFIEDLELCSATYFSSPSMGSSAFAEKVDSALRSLSVRHGSLLGRVPQNRGSKPYRVMKQNGQLRRSSVDRRRRYRKPGVLPPCSVKQLT